MPHKNMSYQFFIAEDLTYKARPFIQHLESMVQLDAELAQFIHHETTESSGEIIEKTNEEIIKEQKINRIYMESYETVMNNAARIYDDDIFRMNWQDITLYYDIIVKNKK